MPGKNIETNKLEEALERTKLMMDATPVGSMLWNNNGDIFDCNEECVKLFKMKDKQDFIDNFFSLSPEIQPDGQNSKEMVRHYFEKGYKEGRYVFEWVHQMMDGTPIPCEMTVVRVKYEGDYVVAAYVRDLREHKQMMEETLRLQTELEVALKQAQEANKAKSNFLASMSHEMRTPLNAVVGLSELLLNHEELPGECEDKLEKIHVSGMMILGIVNDILDISKIESGKFELQQAEYDTPSLINDIVSLNVMRIGEKPIGFKLSVSEDLPVKLLGDELRVKQIFNNLLSNAFKYTDSGTVEWSVSYEKDGDDIWLVSKVRDTGIGIKPKDIKKLFSDYSQVNTRSGRKTEGTGLGLSITKRLVEMMDGEITVESEYGEGSVFSVRMRQQYMSDKSIGRETAGNLTRNRFTTAKRGQHANLTQIDLSYARVLVVDDMPTNLDVAMGMLAPYGIRVDCATSGRQAIDLIWAGAPKYDAIFMDHMMPEMDGIEATKIIRKEIDTDYARNIPIIALTANAIAGNEKMFLENGFHAFISKPIDVMLLDSILRQWVRNKDKEKELENDIHDGYDNNDDHDNDDNDNDDIGIIDIKANIKIEGLDTAAGMERFGNDEAVYLKVLESYTKNTQILLNDLNKHLSEENMKDYAITVHGIKGSSFGIGAEKIGIEAQRLERFAKAGKVYRVKAHNDIFIEYTGNLIRKIEKEIEKYDPVTIKQILDEPDKMLLQELRKACKDYDPGRVEKTMSRLESFEYDKGGTLIAWLSGHVEQMNYEVISGDDWPQ